MAAPAMGCEQGLPCHTPLICVYVDFYFTVTMVVTIIIIFCVCFFLLIYEILLFAIQWQQCEIKNVRKNFMMLPKVCK